MFNYFFVALRVVFPMLVLMLVGAAVRKAGLIDRASMLKVDKLNFIIFTPALIFFNIYKTDISNSLNWKLAIFVACAMLFSATFGYFVAKQMIKDRKQLASVAQAILRANYILFGIAAAGAIYGNENTGFIALYGIVVNPAINTLAVTALEVSLDGTAKPLKLIRQIIKNPIIIASLSALVFLLIKLQIPNLLLNIIKDIGSLATTLAFISLGVSIQLSSLKKNIKPIALALVCRMFILPVIIVFTAIMIGFRGRDLCLVMVLFTSPVGVASYPMAVSVGADGELAGQLVYTSTILSLFTIFIATFILSYLGML